MISINWKIFRFKSIQKNFMTSFDWNYFSLFTWIQIIAALIWVSYEKLKMLTSLKYLVKETFNKIWIYFFLNQKRMCEYLLFGKCKKVFSVKWVSVISPISILLPVILVHLSAVESHFHLHSLHLFLFDPMTNFETTVVRRFIMKLFLSFTGLLPL